MERFTTENGTVEFITVRASNEGDAFIEAEEQAADYMTTNRMDVVHSEDGGSDRIYVVRLSE